MYINLLTKLKNAQAIKKESLKTAYSKMNESILKILASQNYISDFERKGQKTKKFLDIKLKYLEGEGVIKGEGVINGVKFISKPSRRIYFGYKEIKPIKNGYGLLVLSTPKGVMAGQEAKKNKIGGEALFAIW